jgi:oligosaccharide repeat unit polymerase
MLLIYITKKKLRITVLFLPFILATITLGFRYMLIIIFGAPLIYYYLKNKKRPKNKQIVIFVILAFLVVGAVGGGRTGFRTGGAIDNKIFSFQSMYNEFMINNDIYHPFYGMIYNIPARHDYFYGSSFAYVFIAPIPRAIWPGKPQPPVKEILYYSLYSYKAIASGRAFPNIGELYANFGMLGIILGMYLFGAIQKLLYRYYKINQENIYVLIAYSITWPFILQYVSRGYFVQIFTAFVFIFFPLGVVYIFNKRCKVCGIE